MFYTYALYSRKFDRIYIGQTDNLQNRLKRHNKGKVKSTKPYIPWEIVYYEKFNSRTEAIRRERELKSHKGRDFIRDMLQA
jgi:putative endonuclease